ncbi:orotate phosphoribosyltransferase [Ammoniphilus sp. CFH 90114]|uniref:orotate phosphoribosyltransferase n=1 Tax=Ammoniphilus sp. CFH 90114 TaxID=2493665 RepID=UPI00100E953E|nr:orotate phosphoribosyltransferase [Ammoniphilus sp. CFH 90114]RXT15034.1 orotate phosphoribosyltransferase [Ammoniphilus sp. CFH 90114]
MEQREKQIAKQLLEIGAVHLRPDNPFTWTSGLRSPIYCDNRMTMSYPEVRASVARAFAELVREKYPEAEVIAGTATAGIPHAAWVANELELPMIYVRDKAKGHGRNNQIEGVLREGQKVVVIEDLISTGGSSIKAADAVKEAGGQVLSVLAIFSYQFDKAEKAFSDAGYPMDTISNYTALLEQAKEQGILQEEQVTELAGWRLNPEAYTAKWNS